MVYFNRNSTGETPEGIQSTLAFAGVVFVLVVTSLMIVPGADGLLGAYLAALMLGIACNDARHYRIPNELTAAAFGIALLREAILPNASTASILWPVFRASAVSLPLFFLLLFYRYWRGRDGLGLGDVKLAAVAGAWLELPTAAAVIELAALSAIAAYTANALVRRRSLRGTAFLPFGLFMAPAIWIGWLSEQLLLRWGYFWPG
ncbi:A24 family peptidase [Bradyrhizobium sp. Arg816]|uniref:prepilin peptidase n=1 Tax=Bradyrhizobium sp. Arg816 TaxID=2998491 RepID=UPI00249F79A4|nr:A24 family peptidase [Bradyrhizobium sp. Arg816]MDI3566247.1 A24 family peptidase [Bradyrhizobium sp. Arg816]